ncbi:MAG: hypothetical protein GXO82_07205 [Chlorobi bacterium]|nr:hypothetical protein [Chlorobiota bacterium]
MQEYKLNPGTGCTVGVVHVSGGILFFKNRDLQREHLVNKLTVFQSNPEVYALKGINLKAEELKGISIGVNKHKICVANTHVVATEDVAYDVLCEALLSQARERRDVPQIVGDFMRHNAVQGGRILVSSPGWTYLVEVYRKAYRIQEIETDIAITNSFSLLPNGAEMPEIWKRSSDNRLEVANTMIKEIDDIDGLKSMLRSHIPEKGDLSICNHREDGGGTESSHIIQVKGDYVAWSSLVGYPCKHDYNTVQLFQE